MEQKAIEIKNRFAAMALENRLPHTILLEGGNARELSTLANQIAMIAVCTDPAKKPCTKCGDCKKAKGGNHPDIITVEEKDKKRKSVSVDLMRWVREDAVIKPNEAAKKIYLIPKADTMTREAQNALLKLLEEPPPYAMFLLLCTNATAMLATIRSRAQIYSLSELPVWSAAVSETAAQMALAIVAPTEADLLFAAAPLVKAKDRERFQNVLLALELILRDACVTRSGGTAMLSGADESVTALCKGVSHRQLLDLLEEVRQTRIRNERNCNLALLITCLCAHLRRLSSR